MPDLHPIDGTTPNQTHTGRAPDTMKTQRTQTMKTIILASAAALAFTLPAAAQIPFGVDTSGLSTADVIQLERAYEENDNTRINFILSGGSNLDAAEIERRGVAQAIARSVEQNEFAKVNNLPASRAGGVSATASSRGQEIALARFQEEGNQAAVTAFISRVSN
jgi:hypothetical protein